MQSELKVLTLNCYLLPVNPVYSYLPLVPPSQTKADNAHRLEAICQKILHHQYDIVCLQEVWTESDSDEIRSRLRLAYPHSVRPVSGWAGTGLITLSKYPIRTWIFRAFQFGDIPYPLGSVDSCTGKGVLITWLEYRGKSLSVLNSHPQSELCHDLKDEVRLAQMWEIASMARYCSHHSDLVLTCGDFNADPAFIGVRLFLRLTGSCDAFVESSDKSQVFTTYALPGNGLVDGQYRKLYPADGVRIDHVMCWTRSDVLTVHFPRSTIQPWGPETDRGVPFSDHEAVEALIAVKFESSPPSRIQNEDCVGEAKSRLEKYIRHYEEGYQGCQSRMAATLILMISALLAAVPGVMLGGFELWTVVQTVAISVLALALLLVLFFVKFVYTRTAVNCLSNCLNDLSSCDG